MSNARLIHFIQIKTHYKQDKGEQLISIHVFEVYSTHVYYTSMSEDGTERSKLVQQNRSFNRFNISLGNVRSSVRVPSGRNAKFHLKVPWQAQFCVPPCRSALSQTLTRSVGPYCIHDVLIAINKNPFLFILSTQLYCSAICWYFWKINKTAKTEIGLFILFSPTFLLPLLASCSARFENFKISCFWEAAGKTRLAQGGR